MYEFEALLSQIDHEEGSTNHAPPTFSVDFDEFLTQAEEVGQILAPIPLLASDDDDLTESETNFEMLEVAEGLTRIRQLLTSVSRHKNVSMNTKTLEVAVCRAESELNSNLTSAPQNAIAATEPPQTLTITTNIIATCSGCGSSRQVQPCLKGHPLCRTCKGSCPLCSSRKRVPRRLDWP